MTTRRTPLMDISNNDVTSTPSATGSRRKSGRVVKEPEKFVPDAPSSQQGNAVGKRKRGDDRVENDASEIEDEDEDEDEEDEDEDEESEESAAEEAPAPRKRSKAKAPRKPAAKKPKVNGTASHGDASAVELPSRPKKGKKVLIADRNATGLYADVYTSGMSSDDVVGQFLEHYREAEDTAVTEMVNFMLKSAGCDIQVNDDEIRDIDNVEGKIAEIQEVFQAQNIADYPLVSKAKSSADFRESLASFFKSLIVAMHKTGVMFEEDGALIEQIHRWTASMTSCHSRPFRHTATVVAMAVSSGLCSMIAYESGVAAQVRRQLEGEKKKKGANKGRLADYQQKVETSENKQEFLNGLVQREFDAVYIHRYRDVEPKIRAECVEAMGNWITIWPSVFLDGSYLRYLGWMLSDTVPLVRHQVIRQLRLILEDETSHGAMRHFIERFRPRMVEIATSDSESEIRASGVGLVAVIRDAGMLEPDDIDTIGKLIFDSDADVRKAVVGFFVATLDEVYDLKVEELGGEEELAELLSTDDDNFDAPRQAWIKLKSLADLLSIYDAQDQDEMPSQVQVRNDSEFFSPSGSESRFTRAAQALYEKMPELKDWEILSGYLLFDHSSKATGSKTERALKEALKPSDREEVILLEILNSVVKLALEPPVKPVDDTEKSKRKANKAERAEAKQETARRLAALIPRLLKKYGANPETVTTVLRLEHLLDLEIFQELRQSSAFAKLLDEISMQFSSHGDRGVLTEAGAALLHARGYGDLEEVTENKVQSLWEDAINTLRRINSSGPVGTRGSFRGSVLTELHHNLARLDKLASISNCVESFESEDDENNPLPISILVDIVARGEFQEEDPELDLLEDEVVLSAVRTSMFYFMWKMHALKESITAGEEISDSDTDNLKELKDVFVMNLIRSLSSRATIDPVRLFATGTLLDLHVLFSTLRPAGSKADAGSEECLHSLIKEIEPEVQQELTSIFDLTEKNFAKKAKKKLADPGEDEDPAGLDSDDEEDDEDTTDSQRQAEILKSEQHLCELTGKLVLAILAKVIDASGPLQGKLRTRIQRNKDRIGSNFKQVVQYLEEPKLKKSKKATGEAKKKSATKAKSTEVVVEDEEEEEDEDDPFAKPEVEEGDEEDLRRRELLEEEPATSVVDENDDADEDDIMGD